MERREQEPSPERQSIRAESLDPGVYMSNTKTDLIRGKVKRRMVHTPSLPVAPHTLYGSLSSVKLRNNSSMTRSMANLESAGSGEFIRSHSKKI